MQHLWTRDTSTVGGGAHSTKAAHRGRSFQSYFVFFFALCAHWRKGLAQHLAAVLPRCGLGEKPSCTVTAAQQKPRADYAALSYTKVKMNVARSKS